MSVDLLSAQQHTNPALRTGGSWRESLFRYSLRELFLVTLLCGVGVAWAIGVYDRQRPFKPTHIVEYFASGLSKDVEAARTAIGEEGDAWSFDIPLVLEEERGADREWSCDLRLPWDKSLAFRDELVRRIQGNLRPGLPGEHVDDSELVKASRIAGTDYLGDAIQYHIGDVRGVLRVYVVRTGEKYSRLIASIDERRAH